MKTYRYIPKQTSNRRRRRIRIGAAVLFGCLLVFLFWNGTVRTGPNQALGRAASTLHQSAPLTPEDIKTLEGLVTIAERDAALSPWAFLLHAQTLELKGAPDQALESLREIPSDSAAATDGEIRSLRIMLEQHQLKNAAVPEQVSVLKDKVSQFNRPDLLPELLFVEALYAEDSDKPEEAIRALQTLRKRGKDPLILRKAQTLSQTILSSSEPTAAVLSNETEVLIAEKRFSEAHETVQRARNLTSKDSREYYKALLLEEQVLRKLKRANEADEMLLAVAGSTELDIGDTALLRVAKNAWNVNDQHRALEILDRLQERFPNSPLISESRYVEARILEEIGEVADAKEIYGKLGSEATEATDRIRARKRLAWIYLLREDYGHAAEQFELVRKLSAEHLESLKQFFAGLKKEADLQKPESEGKAREFTETSEDLLLGTFFQGDSLNRLDPIDIKYLVLEEREPKALWETIVGKSPFSYYGFLAAERLGIPYPEAKPTGGCSLPIPEQLSKTILAFEGKRELSDYAQAESDYYFAVRRESLFPLSKDDAFLDGLRIFASRAKTSIDLIAPHRGIEIAETGLRRIARSKDKNTLVDMCQAELRSLSFTHPYPELFKHAAAESRLPIELLYAISRSESFFNPDAESIVGAKGLVQVMPATAKAEGWDEKESLTDPALNLALGAKHLRHILDDYEGEKAYAVAAYNAGGAAVNRWKSRFAKPPVEQWIELIGYPETNKYVKRVLFSERLYREILVGEVEREHKEQ